MRILYNFASRSRPQKCFDALCNVVGLSSGRDYEIVLKLDVDDPELSKYTNCHSFARVVPGKSTSKVDAINRDVNMEGFDILVNLSDDMRFIAKGFDEVISQLCGPDTFLHLPDQYAKSNVSTMTVVGAEYFKRFGYIYHPSYKSFYCDEEATEVAKSLGCYVSGPSGIIEHRHPAAGMGKDDALYRKNQRYWNHDKRNFNERKQKGFPR